jgi:hypothetical protein
MLSPFSGRFTTQKTVLDIFTAVRNARLVLGIFL